VTAQWVETGLDYSENGRKQVRAAVKLERTRLWDSQPQSKEAETEIRRDIPKQMGAPSVVVNRVVRQAIVKRLESKQGEGRSRIDRPWRTLIDNRTHAGVGGFCWCNGLIRNGTCVAGSAGSWLADE
jgi:hypothetical protein